MKRRQIDVKNPLLEDLVKEEGRRTPEEIPPVWAKLREEARTIFEKLNIWQADLVSLHSKAGIDA